MAAQQAEDKGAMEETTIHQGVISKPSSVVLTFSHRQMWTIGNKATPWSQKVLPATATDPGLIWNNSPFHCLPIRAAMFWMTTGELAMLTMGSSIKFLKADLTIHHSSFRSQFITGSSSVGFANSNMQLHGHIFENEGNLPPYEILASGSPIPADTPVVLVGNAINNAIWADRNSESDCTNKATFRFTPLVWDPWFYGGALPPTTASTPSMADLTSLAYHNNMFPMMEKTTIIGRKVADWNRTYDLASQWNGLSIPTRMTHTGNPGMADFSKEAAGGRSCQAFTTQALLNMDVNTSGIAQVALDDMWVVPPDSFSQYVRNKADSVTAKSTVTITDTANSHQLNLVPGGSKLDN